MNPEGDITVRLTCARERVSDVTVASSRTGLPPRLVRGKAASEVQRLVPLLFSICGRAQSAACASAIAAAHGLAGQHPDSARQSLDVMLETVQETIWRLLIDWPKAMGEATLVGPVARVRRAVDAVADDGVTLDALLAIVDVIVSEYVYGMRSDDWLAKTDANALDAWLQDTTTLPARLLRRLADESPALGRSDVALMPEATLDNLSRSLLGELEVDPEYARFPLWAGLPAETGALARQSETSLVAELLERDGQTAAVRFVARLVELAVLIEQLRFRTGGRLPAVRAHAFGSGVGIGLAETARGLLLHRVRVDDGRVLDYCIVAPTEWNFHPNGPLTRGLQGRSAVDVRRLEQEARTVVQSLDPCVACRVEIADA